MTDATRETLDRLLAERILVLDGATGTMIQRHTLTEEDFRGEILADHTVPLKGNNDLLTLTRPDIVTGIHHAFLEAGADIVETNTFSGTTIAQADYATGHLVPDINARGRPPGPRRVRRVDGADARQAALRGRRDRSDQPAPVDLARRRGPRQAVDHLR